MNRALRSFCLLAIGTVAAYAHEVLTHQRIGDAAVAYLQTLNTARPLLPSLQTLLWVGAVNEDDGPLPPIPLPPPFGSQTQWRSIFHFLPLLSVALATCSATDWGLNDAACTSSLPLVPSVMNDFRWSQDQQADSTGLPNTTSVENFGYVVHLLEDMAAPAHARADPHLCFLTPIWKGLFLQVVDSCDPFHLDNNGASPAMPTGSPVIDTSGFTTPGDFFTSLQEWIQQNYYSDHTAFFPGMAGPAKVSEDFQYIYGACIPGVSASTCANGVRKIAHKGPLWNALALTLCGPTLPLSCTPADVASGIDTTIAQEQYAEIGPVMVQQVAAFIQFYAPALTIQLQGDNGTGSVTSSPATGIDCGTTCTALFVNGTMVTLTAADSSTETFSGWSQDCSGTAKAVTVTLTADMTCVANFSSPSILTIQKSGSGTGTVTSIPAGINCGTTCPIQSAPFNGSVQLTAVADPGSSFTSWGGNCSGTSPTTTISVTTSNESCIATFSPGGMLTITLGGTGSGTVTSSPPGIVCGASGTTCTAPFTGSVQLMANPIAGSTFGTNCTTGAPCGWGGACSGTGLMTSINVSGNATCTATFNTPVAVALNPYGASSLSAQPGPYNVQVVNNSETVIPAPANMTVTVLRQVVSECSGLLFSSNITATITAGQMSTSYASAGNVAGRDPACNTLPITTTFTVTGAVLAPSTPLNLSIVPPAELSLSITR